MDRPVRTAGRLRHRVVIQKMTETPDGFGGTTYTPLRPPLYTVWAAVAPASGLELERAHLTQADVSHKVTVRYRTGITPKMAVIYQGRTLNIVSVLNDEERNRWLDLLCKEQPSGG